jgi:hypothetical protein
MPHAGELRWLPHRYLDTVGWRGDLSCEPPVHTPQLAARVTERSIGAGLGQHRCMVTIHCSMLLGKDNRMNKLLAAAVASASLMAVPVMAASNSSNGGSSADKPSVNPTQIEQNIRQDLSKAGYADIQVVPGSFLVHAKDSKGNPTEMMVSPNSVTAITALNQSATNSGNSGQHNSPK